MDLTMDNEPNNGQNKSECCKIFKWNGNIHAVNNDNKSLLKSSNGDVDRLDWKERLAVRDASDSSIPMDNATYNNDLIIVCLKTEVEKLKS